MSTFLLLQRLELLPEAAFAEARAGPVLALENLDAGVNTGRGDARRVERMAKVHNRAGRFHHWILFVVIDELAEGRKLLAATDVVFVILQMFLVLLPGRGKPFDTTLTCHRIITCVTLSSFRTDNT